MDHIYSEPNRLQGFGEVLTPQTIYADSKGWIWKPLAELEDKFLLFYRDSSPNWDILLTLRSKTGDDQEGTLWIGTLGESGLPNPR